MPITQPRMLALISAAKDYQQAITKARALVASELSHFQSGHISASQALTNIDLMIQPYTLLNDFTQSFSVISIEDAHFRTHSSRNRAAAKWQRKRRSRKLPDAFYNPDPDPFSNILTPNSDSDTPIISQPRRG